ncbi:MAG: hypothetical protein JST92_19795, partial [Deltaproteobacteria bacterium]|nr:hypothetical protein [Deltaproteobacteria bacterium]
MRSRLRQRGIASLVALAGALAAVGPARAQDTGVPYLIENWDADRGLPHGSVTCLAQTHDGYLWLGTFNGLARFDGVRFTVFRPPAVPFPEAAVLALFVDAQGTLFASGFGWLAVRQGGEFRLLDEAHGYPKGLRVASLAQDEDERLWVGFQDGSVRRWDDGRLVEGGAPGLPAAGDFAGAALLVRALDHTVWLRRKDGLFHLENPARGAAPSAVTSRWVEEASLRGHRLLGIGAAVSGGVWLAEAERVFLFQGGKVTREHPRRDDSQSIVYLLESKDGALWVGSFVDGVTVHDAAGEAISLTRHHGLTHDTVRALFEDREGNVWVGTDGGGLSRMKPRTFTTWGFEQGLQEETVKALALSKDGSLWVGTHGGGIQRLSGDQLEAPLVRPNLDDKSWIWTVLEDASGQLWFGKPEDGFFRAGDPQRVNLGDSDQAIQASLEASDGTLWIGGSRGVYRGFAGTFTPVLQPSGKPFGEVQSLAEGPSGTVWVASIESGLARIKDGKVVPIEAPADRQGVWGASGVLAEDDGTVWFGDLGPGLSRLKDGTIAHLGEAQGLSARDIGCIVDDRLGHLWIATGDGVLRVEQREADAVADGKATHLHALRFTR